MLKTLQRLFSGPKGNSIGIDIGTESVKLAEVSITGPEPVLLSVGILSMPETVMNDGRIVDSEALASLLRQLVATSGASSRDVVIAIGGRTIFAREVLFPVMEQEELKEAIKWDMDKYVPYEPDSFYHDFAVIGKTQNELEFKVLLVAAPLDVVDSMIVVVKTAGLRPVAVDIEPLAIYRTLDKAADCMVLDIGGLVSQVTVFQQGIPAVTRTIPVGGRHFTEAIMRNLELDYHEAERLKQRQMGLLHSVDCSDEPTVLHSHLEFVIDELVREVRRTAEYYQMQSPVASIDKVFLTGGGAKLDNLSQQLTEKLGIPVALQQQPSTLHIAPALDRSYLDNVYPQLATAIGLALRGGEPL